MNAERADLWPVGQNHGDLSRPLGGGPLPHRPSIKTGLAIDRRYEARQSPQQRGLALAVSPQKADELAGFDDNLLKRRNALMVFGTQSPADALRSPIAHAILEQCATKIFLPNAHGQARDYIDGFGLTQEEFRLVREVLTPESHRFLVKQGHDSVVVELDLRGLDDALAVLSGRTETVALLDRLRAETGDD
ncbi:hypothetical protein ASF81_09885 [Brevundimonas sp. Leaf168]|nr:hypothetical protein ASF81_09885 [Brevundimonas sp. Leaf168]